MAGCAGWIGRGESAGSCCQRLFSPWSGCSRCVGSLRWKTVNIPSGDLVQLSQVQSGAVVEIQRICEKRRYRASALVNYKFWQAQRGVNKVVLKSATRQLVASSQSSNHGKSRWEGSAYFYYQPCSGLVRVQHDKYHGWSVCHSIQTGFKWIVKSLFELNTLAFAYVDDSVKHEVEQLMRLRKCTCALTLCRYGYAIH